MSAAFVALTMLLATAPAQCDPPITQFRLAVNDYYVRYRLMPTAWMNLDTATTLLAQGEPNAPIKISKTAPDWQVTLSHPKSQPVVFTLEPHCEG